MTVTRRDVLLSGASAAFGRLVWTAPTRAAQEANLIIHRGSIVTMNDAQPSVEAIAVKDGRRRWRRGRCPGPMEGAVDAGR